MFVFVRRKILACDSGSAAVEFALVLPAFLGMIFCASWIGWVAFCSHSVHHALDISARALQLKPSSTQNDLLTLVRKSVTIGDAAQNITLSLQFDPASAGTQLAHVTAAIPLSFWIPLYGVYSTNYSTSVTVPVTAN